MSDVKKRILKSTFLCSVCGKMFPKNSNLLRHMRNVHNAALNESPRPFGNNAKLTCPENGCLMTFWRDLQLRDHLKNIHYIDTPVEEFNFDSEEDFLQWKYGMQRESSSEYVKETATKTLASGEKKTYLRCHRSNQHLTKIKTRKRAMKGQGSNKIGKTCPSKIEVVHNKNSTVSVTFWRRHRGHTNDLSHVSLDKPTKDQLARKLQNGFSFKHLLDEVRTEPKDVPKRMILLNRKDLHNIVKAYNISYSRRRSSTNTNDEISLPFDAVSTNTNDEIILPFDQSNNLQNEVKKWHGVNQRLQNKANMIEDLLNKTNLDFSQSIQIEKKLDGVISFLNKVSADTKPSSKFLSTEKVNVNKKIEPHERLVSTNNKTKSESKMILHVHTGNDHSYTKLRL